MLEPGPAHVRLVFSVFRRLHGCISMSCHHDAPGGYSLRTCPPPNLVPCSYDGAPARRLRVLKTTMQVVQLMGCTHMSCWTDLAHGHVLPLMAVVVTEARWWCLRQAVNQPPSQRRPCQDGRAAVHGSQMRVALQRQLCRHATTRPSVGAAVLSTAYSLS